MSDTRLEAGIAKVNITPPLSAPHAGWGAQTHTFADGIDDDLFATVLVLRSGSTTVVLVELDLVIVSRDESDAIRSAIKNLLGIPVECVRVAVTHNHAGPPPSSWNWMPEGREALQSYYQVLPSMVSGAALAASKNLRPALFGATVGSSTVAVNRRESAPTGQVVTGVNWDAPIDPDLLVARIDDQHGEPIAAVVGYTMHPTVMGPSNRLLSPDWPGHMKREFERITGAPCLFVQGATGDIGPGPEGFTDDTRVVRKIGGSVACDAARLYLSVDTPPRAYFHERVWDSGAPLGKWSYVEKEETPYLIDAKSKWVDLPVSPQPSLETASDALEKAQDRLTALMNRGAPQGEIEDATFAVKRANMTLTRARTFGTRDTFPIEVHAIRIGSLVVVGCEGEPFSQIARDIKDESPFEHTWFGGYTGGWLGYVPTADEYPRKGYEVETSPYTADAAEILSSRVGDFLRDLLGHGEPAEEKE